MCARCDVADSHLKRMRGLLGRSSLPADEGLFLPSSGSIHMLFMRFPIDAVFCDAELRVIDVARGLRPWRVAVRRRAKAVIELAEGAARDVSPGDKLTLDTTEA